MRDSNSSEEEESEEDVDDSIPVGMNDDIE